MIPTVHTTHIIKKWAHTYTNKTLGEFSEFSGGPLGCMPNDVKKHTYLVLAPGSTWPILNLEQVSHERPQAARGSPASARWMPDAPWVWNGVPNKF